MAMFYLNNTPHAKTKEGEHIATQNHFDYITREGKYSKLNQEREDMVYKQSGNIPGWAESAKDFWKSAEEHRRVNGRAYREVKLALQEELTLEENIELVNKFLDKFNISRNHTYTFAIHDKPAAFDKSHRNIHAHIMFDERVIEPKRPLNEEQWFMRYSEDKMGNPSGGYYKDRYYTTKDCTQDMRKAWAEIVNEKFREKGIDIQISEKTLKDQYYELKAQGKDEEAEYYDREPAPHMGKAARNPKKAKKIDDYTRDMEREVEDLADPDSDSLYDPEEEQRKTEEEMAKATAEERKMIIFAADALMRRVAREIQKERIAQRNTQRNIELMKEYTEENREPLIITVADIVEAMEEKATMHKEQEALYADSYKQLQKKVLSDKVLHAIAERDVLGLDGRELSKAFKTAQTKDLLLLKKLNSIPKDDPNREDCLMEEVAAARAFRKAEAEYNNYLKRRTMESESVDARLKVLKEEQGVIQKRAADFYKKQLFNANQHDMYYAKMLSLKTEFDQDKIVYADRLPDMVDWSSRFDGKKPVHRMENCFYKGSTYFILNDKKELLNPDRKVPIKAMRYGDFVTQGKAPVYYLDIKLEKAVSPKGKTYTAVKVVGCHEANEKARLYKVHNRLPKADRGHSYSSASTQKTLLTRESGRGNAVEQAINKMANVNSSAPSGRLIRYVPEDEERQLKKNEYDKVLEEQKQWDDSIKLGGRFGR